MDSGFKCAHYRTFYRLEVNFDHFLNSCYLDTCTRSRHNIVIVKHMCLKADLGLGWEDCQHAMTDESPGTVAGCALETDVCHWMFKTKSTWFKVNKIPL